MAIYTVPYTTFTNQLMGTEWNNQLVKPNW